MSHSSPSNSREATPKTAVRPLLKHSSQSPNTKKRSVSSNSPSLSQQNSTNKDNKEMNDDKTNPDSHAYPLLQGDDGSGDPENDPELGINQQNDNKSPITKHLVVSIMQALIGYMFLFFCIFMSFACLLFFWVLWVCIVSRKQKKNKKKFFFFFCFFLGVFLLGYNTGLFNIPAATIRAYAAESYITDIQWEVVNAMFPLGGNFFVCFFFWD